MECSSSGGVYAYEAEFHDVEELSNRWDWTGYDCYVALTRGCTDSVQKAWNLFVYLKDNEEENLKGRPQDDAPLRWAEVDTILQLGQLIRDCSDSSKQARIIKSLVYQKKRSNDIIIKEAISLALDCIERTLPVEDSVDTIELNSFYAEDLQGVVAPGSSCCCCRRRKNRSYKEITRDCHDIEAKAAALLQEMKEKDTTIPAILRAPVEVLLALGKLKGEKICINNLMYVERLAQNKRIKDACQLAIQRLRGEQAVPSSLYSIRTSMSFRAMPLHPKESAADISSFPSFPERSIADVRRSIKLPALERQMDELCVDDKGKLQESDFFLNKVQTCRKLIEEWQAKKCFFKETDLLVQRIRLAERELQDLLQRFEASLKGESSPLLEKYKQEFLPLTSQIQALSVEGRLHDVQAANKNDFIKLVHECEEAIENWLSNLCFANDVINPFEKMKPFADGKFLAEQRRLSSFVEVIAFLDGMKTYFSEVGHKSISEKGGRFLFTFLEKEEECFEWLQRSEKKVRAVLQKKVHDTYFRQIFEKRKERIEALSEFEPLDKKVINKLCAILGECEAPPSPLPMRQHRSLSMIPLYFHVPKKDPPAI